MSVGMSAAVACRWASVPSVLTMGVVSAHLLWRQRAHLKLRDLVLPTALGLSVAAVLLAYNQYRFGNPLVTGIASASPRPGMSLFSFQAFFPRMAALLFSPYRGFFLYAPIYLAGFFVTLRRRSARLTDWQSYGLFVLGANLIFFATYYYWAGGHSFGPRFLIGCSVFLIPLLIDLDSLPKALVWTLGGIGFVFMLMSTALPSSLEDELRDTRGIDRIATSPAWSFDLTPLWFGRPTSRAR